MTQWRSAEPKIWRWRIRARSSDGQMVTLGQYETEDEARLDYDRIIKDKSYRDVTLQKLASTH